MLTPLWEVLSVPQLIHLKNGAKNPHMVWREWNMTLLVGTQKSTCHCWLLLSSFLHKVQIGPRTLAPGSFSRPGCIRDSIGYACEQEGYQIFQKHTMCQPLPAFQLALLEPWSMIHRGSFLNSWPSMRTMKKHLELQSIPEWNQSTQREGSNELQ